MVMMVSIHIRFVVLFVPVKSTVKINSTFLARSVLRCGQWGRILVVTDLGQKTETFICILFM